MSQADIDATEAPLLDHLIELRKRLIYCMIGFAAAFALSFAFSTHIFNILIMPFEWGTGASAKLIQTELLGFFMVKLKIGFFGLSLRRRRGAALLEESHSLHGNFI